MYQFMDASSILKIKQQLGVTPDSSKFGYVILGGEYTNNSVSLYLKEQTGSYPSIDC